MTLYRQLMLMIAFLTFMLFSGTIAVNLMMTRTYVIQQLESHAQDTATSLGMSISQHFSDDDLSTVTAMVDAIFDRGYYSMITLSDLEGRVLVERKSLISLDDVPNWFVSLLNLRVPSSESEIMSGWNLTGSLFVKSHPGYAYGQLWRLFVTMLYWFLAAAIIVSLASLVVLHTLLRPMKAVEKQAQSICDREYKIQENLPVTRELRSMVTAMNRMTETVQRMFQEQAEAAEKMRDLAYQDSVTGVGNRRYFEGQLRFILNNSEKHNQGALLLLQLNGLKELNDTQGFEAGDTLIEATAAELTGILRGREVVLGRLAGAQFGVLIPNANENVASELGEIIAHRLTELYRRDLTPLENVGQVGIAMYDDQPGLTNLFAKADEALRAAQAKGPNEWALFKPESGEQAVLARREWMAYLTKAIDNKNLELYAQPVISNTENLKTLHQEILFRIKGPDGKLCTAGFVMPIAEELGITRHIDRLVIEDLKRFISRTRLDATYAVNLAPDTLRDDRFLEWLFGAISDVNQEHGKLVFEFSELGVVHELDRLRLFSERVRFYGHGIALDHFGRAFSNFGYLQSLRPDYVKIDGAFTADICNSKDDQFFVKTLANIAHSLEIDVIAEMVETEAQAEVLRGLKLDGIQGYIVGKPEPLNQNQN